MCRVQLQHQELPLPRRMTWMDCLTKEIDKAAVLCALTHEECLSACSRKCTASSGWSAPQRLCAHHDVVDGVRWCPAMTVGWGQLLTAVQSNCGCAISGVSLTTSLGSEQPLRMLDSIAVRRQAGLCGHRFNTIGMSLLGQGHEGGTTAWGQARELTRRTDDRGPTSVPAHARPCAREARRNQASSVACTTAISTVVHCPASCAGCPARWGGGQIRGHGDSREAQVVFRVRLARQGVGREHHAVQLIARAARVVRQGGQPARKP